MQTGRSGKRRRSGEDLRRDRRSTSVQQGRRDHQQRQGRLQQQPINPADENVYGFRIDANQIINRQHRRVLANRPGHPLQPRHRLAEITRRARVAKAISAAARSDAKLSWLNPVQTQYHKAERLAQQGKFGFKRVFDLGQKFLSDISRFAIQAENSAPTLFHQIRSFADAKQAVRSALGGDFGASTTQTSRRSPRPSTRARWRRRGPDEGYRLVRRSTARQVRPDRSSDYAVSRGARGRQVQHGRAGEGADYPARQARKT